MPRLDPNEPHRTEMINLMISSIYMN